MFSTFCSFHFLFYFPEESDASAIISLIRNFHTCEKKNNIPKIILYGTKKQCFCYEFTVTNSSLRNRYFTINVYTVQAVKTVNQNWGFNSCIADSDTVQPVLYLPVFLYLLGLLFSSWTRCLTWLNGTCGYDDRSSQFSGTV